MPPELRFFLARIDYLKRDFAVFGKFDPEMPALRYSNYQNSAFPNHCHKNENAALFYPIGNGFSVRLRNEFCVFVSFTSSGVNDDVNIGVFKCWCGRQPG